MEWQQLEYFRTVAKLEHFTKAAARLSISQPALSRAILKLEEELGVPLFDRIGRVVRLNEFGRTFLAHVERGFLEIQKGVDEVQRLNDPESGEVSVAFTLTFGLNWLPDILHPFTQQYPHLHFQLFQNTSNWIIRHIAQGQFDIGIINNTPLPQGMEYQKLMDEEMFIFLPVNHALAHAEALPLSALTHERFIGFRQNVVLRTITEQYLREAGFTPSYSFEGDDVPTMAGLVGAGIGAAILPMYKGIDLTKVRRIRITKPICRREIGMIWQTGRALPASVELFKQFLITQCEKLQILD